MVFLINHLIKDSAPTSDCLDDGITPIVSSYCLGTWKCSAIVNASTLGVTNFEGTVCEKKTKELKTTYLCGKFKELHCVNNCT